MQIKQGIPVERRLEVITWSYEYFKHVTSKEYFFALIPQETNWDNSVILVDENDTLLGAYLFGDLQVDSVINSDKYKDLKGIEGILLAVDSSIRNQGWGNKLKDFPSTLGYDYVWGQQLKELNNLNDWLKRRVLVGETDGVYVTLEEFSK